MTSAPKKRRLFLFFAAFAFVVLGAGLWARLTLTEMAVSSLLKSSGASDVKFTVEQASPWKVVLGNIGFQVKTQLFAAKRISMARLHWWTPSLGVVRIEEAQMPVTIDGSDVDARAWTVYKNPTLAHAPASLPVEEVHVDGQLVIRAADTPDQALTVKLDAHLIAKNSWAGKIEVTGPGLGAKGDLGYDLAKDQVSFNLPSLSLDLKPWEGFVQRVVVMPGGGTWDMEGKLTGHAEGNLNGKKLLASGAVSLRDGRVRDDAKDITAEGIEADLEFTDFDKMLTKPGAVRIRELRVGAFPLREISAELAFAGTEKISISSLSLKVLGGTASTEPFNYFPNLRELDAVVLADGISIEEIMGLTKDLPAKASGRVNGRFPIHIDDSGLRLGTGWLQLKPGVYAELQLQANGLLTGNLSENSPSYGVLKKVESGLLKLKLDELRLDIRPPNAPPGRSAQLRISGSPVDPNVKAPITLDLNVNGPLEKLLNLGMNSRLSFK
ncbi:MAG: YdbH domain-containing protein [Lacunisphaera sp.]